jgi:PadR family transcriptional regulator, regulatory protein PadR
MTPLGIRPMQRIWPATGSALSNRNLTATKSLIYMVCQHMSMDALARELKRGSTELLILALLEEGDRHGYQLAQLIDERSRGAISFHVASLYPTLYRMEGKSLIEGRWVEKAGQRRRRYYSLTKAGKAMLASQRSVWDIFFDALNRVARIRHA